MIVVIGIAGLILGLVILYLISPHYRQFSVSFIRYIPEISDRRSHERRIRWQSLLLSRSFWAQFLALVFLLLTVLLPKLLFDWNNQQKHVGVWIALDTSASMSTMQGTLTRMDLAHSKIENLVAYLNQLQTDTPVCINLSTFDLEESTRELAVTPQKIQSAVNDITYGRLGTDMGLIRSLITRSNEQDETGCPISHLLVITDIPFPVWVNEEAMANNLQIIWLDIASPVDNIGIVDARRAGTILDATNEIEVKFVAYGNIPSETTLTVANENGNIVYEENFSWNQISSHQLVFTLPGAGPYTLAISEGGAYTFDDELTIVNEDTEQIRVDWQLPGSPRLNLPGWTFNSTNPHVRIAPYPSPLEDGMPTLFVGNGYQENSPDSVNEIRFFAESPLLDDINLDVAETLNINGISLTEDDSLQPILYDDQGQSWIAISEKLPAAYVPGLPVFTADENLTAFSNTVFFNALRWLLQAYTPKPLYDTNTLYPDEGYTQSPVSYDSIESIQPLRVDRGKFPIWLVLLLVATIIFLIERSLTKFGGAKWM